MVIGAAPSQNNSLFMRLSASMSALPSVRAATSVVCASPLMNPARTCHRGLVPDISDVSIYSAFSRIGTLGNLDIFRLTVTIRISGCKCLRMNDVGEPRACKPHARTEGTGKVRFNDKAGHTYQGNLWD